ncbi:hypothetical protein CDL15_Pgr002718 [Punica granatum]|uniref:Uncharacterized protein n=1 Tax=Punica granatum TaxID=22663 RepID=A0A218W279_PUNGR|nr:hypothetical protein CDL15_Pgr002718 [Punica granatum]
MDTKSWTRSPKSGKDGPESEGHDPLDSSSYCAYDGAVASVVRRLSQDWALCVSLRVIRSDWDFVLLHKADMSPSGRDTFQDSNAHTCTQGIAANGRCQSCNTAGITMCKGNLCSDASGIWTQWPFEGRPCPRM